MDKLKKYRLLIWLVIAGILIKWPLFNEMLLLVQGDIGRDLYVYEMVSKGAVPYRDVFYWYGPLMTWYYAAFFKLLGVNCASLLIGRAVLEIAAALFLYGIVSRLANRVMAVLAALWFLAFMPTFIHTFTHTGGILFAVMFLYFIVRFFDDLAMKWMWWASAVLWALMLVKYNMAAAAFGAASMALAVFWLMNRSRVTVRKILTAGLIMAGGILLAVLVYVALFWGEPWYYVQQCFPALNKYSALRWGGWAQLFQNWGELFTQNLGGITYETDRLSKTPAILPHRLFFVLSCFALISGVIYLFKEKMAAVKKRWLIGSLFFLAMTVLLLGHEAIFGSYYYSRFWAIPSIIALIFILAGLGLSRQSRLVRWLSYGVLAATILMEVHGKYMFEVWIKKMPQQFIDHPKVQVYVENNPEWTNTVKAVIAYLDKNLKPGEPFLAIPYEPLYFYLTDRPMPVREYCFFNQMGITDDQQRRIIQALDEQALRYVIMSNRAETGGSFEFGVFGQTNNKLLAQYIAQKYELVQQIGPWVKDADWCHQHGVRIYRRKDIK